MSKTTIVVEFGDSVAEDDQFSVIELDDTMNLDADGNVKTQFGVTDEPVFLVHLPGNLYVDRIAATDGGVVWMGSDMLDRYQELVFTSDAAQTLSYFPAGQLVPEWQGVVGTGMQRDGRDLSISANWPARLHVTYPVEFRRYRLISPAMTLDDDATYKIDVVIYVEAQ